MEELNEFASSPRSSYKPNYSKKELDDFLNYVIKKTEENVEIIKYQKDEINNLRKELETYKKLENTYDYIKQDLEKSKEEMKELAKREADLILDEAKNNANKIINDALIRSHKMEVEKNILEHNMRVYKKKIRALLIDQLNEVEEIEIL